RRQLARPRLRRPALQHGRVDLGPDRQQAPATHPFEPGRHPVRAVRRAGVDPLQDLRWPTDTRVVLSNPPPPPPLPPPPGGRGESALPPVIVYPHGGPESQTRPNFNGLFQYFVQRGYAILAPNVRGSTGQGTAYMNLDNTTKRMDSVKDLAHAAYWLRDEKK